MAKSIVKQLEEVKARLVAAGYSEIRSGKTSLLFERKFNGGRRDTIHVSLDYNRQVVASAAWHCSALWWPSQYSLAGNVGATAKEAMDAMLAETFGATKVAVVVGIPVE